MTSPRRASMRGEFAWSPDEAERAEKFGTLGGELTTDLHEVLGHASGRQKEGVTRSPQELIKEHFSALEEGRADLVALYFLAGPEDGGARDHSGRRPRRRRPRRVRGIRAQRAGPAAAGARGHADRGRPYAEPADDRALADGEHEGDRGAHPRRQALPRDGGLRRVPRGRGASAGRSAADQVRRRRRGCGEAVRHLRHPFRRRRSATRSSSASTR